MNTCKLILLTAAAGALALPLLASADCSHYTEVRNDSSITMHVVELKSAIEGGWYKSQWTGDRSIAAGATTKINWTSDFSCENNGVPRRFSVKLFRKDGTDHECGSLAQSQGVTLDTPDLCFAR